MPISYGFQSKTRFLLFYWYTFLIYKLSVIYIYSFLLICTANLNSVPTPYFDVQVIFPPSISTICLDIFNPRPMP